MHIRCMHTKIFQEKAPPPPNSKIQTGGRPGVHCMTFTLVSMRLRAFDDRFMLSLLNKAGKSVRLDKFLFGLADCMT